MTAENTTKLCKVECQHALAAAFGSVRVYWTSRNQQEDPILGTTKAKRQVVKPAAIKHCQKIRSKLLPQLKQEIPGPAPATE
jgi:hypothetical protein